MMQTMIQTDAWPPCGGAQRTQQRRTVRVLLSAEKVLHDSSVIEGVIEAIFERLPTTTVVVCVRRQLQDAHP
jgi:hypothetical protein